MYQPHDCSLPSPTDRSGTIVLASVTCLFVRVFVRLTLWFPDSHCWTKPHRILLFGTMIDPIKTLPGIVCQLPSPIFDLVITYFVSLEFAFRTPINEPNHIGSCFFVLCHCHWKWFPKSHPWTMLARILLFWTIRDCITVMLLIAPDCSSIYLIYILELIIRKLIFWICTSWWSFVLIN